MSVVLPDELLELRDENERLVNLLIRVLDGINAKHDRWFTGPEMTAVEYEWEVDARKAACWGMEGPE